MNRTFCGSTFMLDSADMKNILDGFPMTSAFTPEAYCKYNENDKFDSTHRMTLSHSLSVLTAIFPGEPELAGFIEAKDDASGCDKLTTGAMRCAKLQSNQHQQTNTQRFTGRMPFLSPDQQCQSTEWKNITFHDCTW